MSVVLLIPGVLRLPAPADAAVVVPVPVATVVIAAIHADARARTHGTDMCTGAHAVRPGTSSHADRADLYAGARADLRRNRAGGDQSCGKKQCGPKLHVRLLSVDREVSALSAETST
jgi:hypothetical protein